MLAVRHTFAIAAVASLVACAPRTRSSAEGGARGDAAPVAVHPASDAGLDPCESLTAEQRNMVVARIGDTTLTLCGFAQRMNLQNQYLRARFSAPEQRRALLRNWVDSELLAAEARSRGLDQDPSVQHAITAQLARQLETEIRSTVHPPEVSDADVEQYFAQHRADYDTPEQARASHIVLPTRERAQTVLTDARAHAADDAYWRDLARRESQDALTRETGGDLGFFTAQGGNSVPAEVAAAVFQLHRPGEVGDSVVESAHGGPGHARGFHVVRLVARRDALHRSVDEVRRPIRNRLWRERFDTAQQAAVQALIDRLRTEAHVSVDDAALAQVQLNVPPAAPGDGGVPVMQPGAPVAAPR